MDVIGDAPRCVCGHPNAWHDGHDAGGECDACGCRAYLSVHLPGQVMLGDGDDALPVDNP